MSKLPSFQFYPGDWMKDPSLRSISPLARGVWMDILCVMFESEKRGYLQINGKAPSEEQIARMVGCSGDEISRAMSELREASVFSTTANGVIYSRRIVRDEEIRNKRSKSGTLGGNPSFQKGKPNPYYEKDKQNHNQGDKQKITPSSSSSSSYSSSDSKEKESPPYPPKSKSVEIPEDLSGNTDEILAWLDYKREKGQGYKAKGLESLWRMIRSIHPGSRKAAIEQSMACNYAGIFPPKGAQNGNSRIGASPVPGKYAHLST